MKRQAQAVVLFLIGGTVIRASFTDLYLRYVKAGLRPFLLVAGVVLITAAVATVWYEVRRPREGAANRSASEHGDSGGHTHHEPRIAWFLALPVLALILVAPPPPGSYSAGRTGTALQRPPGFPTLPAGDPLRLSVLDYAGRAVFDHGRSLDDRKIKLTGFITLGDSGAPYLSRMSLNCCAADAQPVKVGLSGRVPPTLQPDAWLEITGTYSKKKAKDPVNDGAIPFIDVSRARPVKAPHNQYEN